MLNGISIICFASSYAIALCLEVSRLFYRIPWRTAIMVGFVAAGLVAHALYLASEARRGLAAGPPLSSWYHGCLAVAWLLGTSYVVLAWWRKQTAIGLLVLPTVLALIGVAQVFPRESRLSSDQAYRVWSIVHGMALLLGTVFVVVGFLAGLMYLIQSYRLKHKMVAQPGLRLPSLERLQGMNEGCLIVSCCLLVAGLVSGVLLNLIMPGGDTGVPWSDPVVWTSGILLLWLVAVLIFSGVYRPARQGRKVAYLTVASFLFLGLVLGMILLDRSAHGLLNQPSGGAARILPWGNRSVARRANCRRHGESSRCS
jgi:ABC-type uncharacterized transport system permease subunit